MAQRGSGGIATLFLDHGLRRGEDSASRPDRFCPREGGWVGPRDGLERCGKSRPRPGFDPRTVQPVASRYTDYATRSTWFDVNRNINPLTPNDHYSGRTAPLTSKRCILYIYSTNTGTEYFKHGIHYLFFFIF